MGSLVAFPKATVKLQTVKGGESIDNVNDRVELCPGLNGRIFVIVWPT